MNVSLVSHKIRYYESKRIIFREVEMCLTQQTDNLLNFGRDKKKNGVKKRGKLKKMNVPHCAHIFYNIREEEGEGGVKVESKTLS